MAKDFIKLKVTGNKELSSRLQRINGQLIAALRVGIHKALIELEGEVKTKLSGKVLNVQTGTLRRSIGRKISQFGNQITGFIGTNLKYGRIHEFGGEIKIKKAKWLRFKTRDGKWHSVKKVTMPERSYLRSTLREKESQVLDIVQREIKKLVEG